MYNDFFETFFKSWDRPVKESFGYKSIRNEDGYLIVVNTIGISKENLELDVVKNALNVKGKAEIKEINFTNNVNYSFDLSTIEKNGEEITSIDYELKDGYTYIYIKVKETERKVLINYKK